MMLTPEQLEGLRFALEATVHAPGLSVEAAHDLFNHIDAQQARIAELDGLLQSASSDCNTTANERNELRGQYASLLSLLADIRAACGDNGKRMQDELVAYISELARDMANAAAAERERVKAICGNVIDEWFNCAGGADEVLRRIEEYEQNGEAKP